MRFSPRSWAKPCTVAVGLALITLSVPAHAQAVRNDAPVASVQSPSDTPAATVDSTAPGPRATSAGITRPTQPQLFASPAPQGRDHVHAGENVALMGAGIAGVVIGLLVGGDGGHILALGGGVVAIVGLYRYLQ